MLGVHQEKRAPFSLARSHAPDLPQRRRSARVKLRWRCAALRAPLHCAPFLRPAGLLEGRDAGSSCKRKDVLALSLRPLLWPAGRATRGSGKKAFGHPFPQRGGRERSVLASVQRTVPTQGRACLPRPMPAERLKKVSVFCLAK